MPIQKLRPTFTFTEDRLKQLEQVVPEAFADGKIDWETLQEALGEELEDGREEHFGLTWPGKREARRKASIPPTGTLIPCPGEGVNEDSTENIFIEGENLEVLKILLKSYAGKVKMIYIDPPYNTGNDFVYNDNFTDPLDEYLKYTGSKGDSGELLTSNTRADGRFHSRWLNMMYPRLILARQFLRDDGVIFVSIDDNEEHHLRQLLTEIFGDENFIGVFVWEKKKKGAFLSGSITNVKEYVVCYSKNIKSFPGLMGEVTSETETYPVIKSTNTRGTRIIRKGIASKFCAKNHIVPSGTRISSGNMELILLSDMIIKDNILVSDVLVDSNWIYSQDLLDEYAEDGNLYVTQDLYFRRIVSDPREKKIKDIFPRVGLSGIAGDRFIPNDNLFIDGWGTNEDGNAELHNLLGVQNVFSFPKPSKLLAKLISSYPNDEGIIMDFFAGSGTLGDAIFQLTSSANKRYKFILVQFPEIIDPLDKKNLKAVEFCDKSKIDLLVSEICKERLRRAISKITNEILHKSVTSPLFQSDISTLNLGFMSYKLSSSSFKDFSSNLRDFDLSLSSLFENEKEAINLGWSKKNLSIELLLIEGFPLTSKFTPVDSITSNIVYEAAAPDFCDHKLFICLDEKFDPITAEQLILDRHDIFICLDSALNDELKVRLADRFNVHII